MRHPLYFSAMTLAIAITVMAGIVLTRLSAQTIIDNPPTITLSVTATSPQTWRPGGRGYFTTTISDDKALKSVVVTTSPTMYSSPTITMFQCDGKTFCEEKVYTIVPSNPGSQFVTVTATDSADQVSTQTVNFDAPVCIIDADCGTSDIQWAGASFCGSEGGGLETNIMQYGVAGACKSGGICDTASLPRVKQKCASGQVCTYGQNGVNLCIAQPTECVRGAPITSVCTCGKSTLNYPYDYRVSHTPTYCCSQRYGGSAEPQWDSCPQICPTDAELRSQEGSCAMQPGFQWERYWEGDCLKVRCNATATTTYPTPPPPSTSTSGSSVIPSQSASTTPSVESPNVSTTPSTLTTIPAAQHPSASPPASQKILPQIDTKENMRTPPQEQKKPNVAKVKKELQLLKNRRKETNTKIKYIEKKIASLEKKIDAKLQLIDRLKKAAVSKRAHAQIDRWEEKIFSLEEQQDKLEMTADGIEKSIAEFQSAATE